MKASVTKDKVSIIEKDIVHAGEYNINHIEFEFSAEYTADLVKNAVFSIKDNVYQTSIINDQCDIPAEILSDFGEVVFGVYAYKVNDDQLELRYSPFPARFTIISGSYDPTASESEEITPSQFEQYMQAMNDGLNKVEESIKKMDEATSSATQLVDDINQKLENGEFIGPEGPQGVPGNDGIDGVGITTITSGQSTVEDDKTVTPVTVQKSDGSSESFNVEAKNGLDGQNGKDGKDGVNGQDGLTPSIGENGNWYLGDKDTGKPSRGKVGPTPDLSDYVKNTDYASASKAGVLKINGNAARISSDGVLSAAEVSEEQYKTTVNSIFISKGTLDNVKNFLVDSSTPVITLNSTLDNLVRKNRVSDYIVSLKDALKYKVFEFLVHGKVKQETTTGKNLLNYLNVKQFVSNGLLSIINNDGSITTTGTPTMKYVPILESINITDMLEDGQTYTIMQKNATNKLYIQVTITTNSDEISYIGLNNNTENIKTFTVDKQNNKKYSINIQSNTIETTGELNITNYYQLLKGSYDEWQPFEKYTRGQPSPNPDYPQEISTLTFDKITRCGKNLFDKDTVPDLLIYPHTDRLNSTTDNYSAIFKCLPNTTYSISKTSLSTTSLIVCGTKDYPETGDFPLNRQVYSNSNIANGYTTTEDTNYLVIRYCNPEDTLSHSEIFSTIQIEFGPQATDYEAYQATEYAIDLQGNEMVEIPKGIKDELAIDKQGNVSLVKNVEKVIFDGSDDEDWTFDTISTGTNIRQFHILFENIYYNHVYDKITVLSNYFRGVPWASSWLKNNTVTPYKYGDRTGLRLYSDNFEDLNAFKVWLSTHNVIVYYQLATPEVIPLGKLTNLITTEEGINTFFINGNLETTLEVLYALDIKKYIDNKLAEISSAMIEEG